MSVRTRVNVELHTTTLGRGLMVTCAIGILVVLPLVSISGFALAQRFWAFVSLFPFSPRERGAQ